MEIISMLKNRHKTLEKYLLDNGLDAALFVGNSSIGPLSYGYFRYYTDWRCYYHQQAFLMRPGSEPIIFVGSILHLQGVQERGFTDIRISPFIRDNVLKELCQNPPKRLGVCLDMIAADWYDAFEQQLPGMQLADISSELYELRSLHDDIEVERIRQCALIADAGYEAVCSIARPGVKMSDIHTELDYAMRKAGAEEVFTLISNGRFKYYTNGLPCIRAFGWPDDRIVQPGDNIGMEITPRFGGYWTQLVRTICIGEPSDDLVKAHKDQLAVMNNTLKQLIPGNTLGNVLKDMWHFGQSLGYEPKLPFGHIMGLDMDEGGRGSLDSDFVLKENTSVVLHPTMTLGDMDYSIFWGDNYLVTADGGERLNKCSTELIVL